MTIKDRILKVFSKSQSERDYKKPEYEVMYYWDVVHPTDKLILYATNKLYPRYISISGTVELIPHPDKNHWSNKQ